MMNRGTPIYGTALVSSCYANWRGADVLDHWDHLSRLWMHAYLLLSSACTLAQVWSNLCVFFFLWQLHMLQCLLAILCPAYWATQNEVELVTAVTLLEECGVARSSFQLQISTDLNLLVLPQILKEFGFAETGSEGSHIFRASLLWSFPQDLQLPLQNISVDPAQLSHQRPSSGHGDGSSMVEDAASFSRSQLQIP